MIIKSTAKFRYYVCNDLINQDDDGEDQVSIYRTWFDSDEKLDPREAVKLAEEEGDWKIDIGQGDWGKVDSYYIEIQDRETKEYSTLAEEFRF